MKQDEQVKPRVILVDDMPTFTTGHYMSHPNRHDVEKFIKLLGGALQVKFKPILPPKRKSKKNFDKGKKG